MYIKILLARYKVTFLRKNIKIRFKNHGLVFNALRILWLKKLKNDLKFKNEL